MLPPLLIPGVESTDREEAFSALVKSGSFVNSPDQKARQVLDALLLSTGSIDDLTLRHHKSAPAGYDYFGAVDGTDSVAFGGWKK